jgi:hypothetical protein
VIAGDCFEGFYATRNLERTLPPHSAHHARERHHFVPYTPRHGVERMPHTAEIIQEERGRGWHEQMRAA